MYDNWAKASFAFNAIFLVILLVVLVIYLKKRQAINAAVYANHTENTTMPVYTGGDI